ncbi:YufK family protein [Bacillus sp. ISL-51]|uniref:YufK family protein n=1 Tax=Bacteria TaxID=2 RepID=UPI001BE969AD|nr:MULTISPECIES: YufK family protein [Bacteria]MBT2575613.1 YufK family protein [Bacillus sp. ISL-51]MBT2635791.1 YufK family protein [Bacillus sp. ISL-26]MBT2711779.1 YufK family protein [Pseudomonas sp. ISL-88]
MKNTYWTGYFPLVAILLFSSSLSISTSLYAMKLLQTLGMYQGMLDYFSEKGIRLALFAAFALVYFMVFSALKLIANTVTELSLLFFTNDPEGDNLKKIRLGSLIYVGGGILSFALVQNVFWIAALFAAVTLVYLIFMVYRIYATLSIVSLIGFILLEILFWFTFVIGILYIFIKLYNSIMASLPV